MKELDYTSEKDFKSKKISFSDEHYALASQIWSAFGNYGPMIVKDDNSLCFCVNKYTGNDRVERELSENKYRITIEKIEGQTKNN